MNADSANEGKLVNLTYPSKIFLESQLERDVQACFYCEDSYLLLADVTTKWTEKPAGIHDPDISGEWTWQRYLKGIESGITVPPDTVLDCPEARQTAMKQPAEAEGWTDDVPEMFKIWVSAYYVLDDNTVWFFGLRIHSYTEKEYESDAAMDRYHEELDQAFSKVNQSVPREIGILINERRQYRQYA